MKKTTMQANLKSKPGWHRINLVKSGRDTSFYLDDIHVFKIHDPSLWETIRSEVRKIGILRIIEVAIIITVIAIICIAVMIFGQASGIGAAQCFGGVAC